MLQCGRELAVSILDSVEESSSSTSPSFRFYNSSSTLGKSASFDKSSSSAAGVKIDADHNSSDCGDQNISGIHFNTSAVSSSLSESVSPNSRPVKCKSVPSTTPARRTNPLSRLANSQFGNLTGVKLWLRTFLTSTSSALHNTASSSVLQTPMLSSRKSPARVSPSTTPSSRPRPLKGRSPKLGPPSSPSSSPKVPRSKSQSRTRRLSWTASDAENREPVAGSSTGRPAKYGLGNSPKAKTHKLKNVSPKKSISSKALTFTDIEEACSSTKGSKKLSKVCAKHTLTSSVSLTPSLDVHLSIDDTPSTPTLVKKVEKVRRERSKVVGNFKKLKTGCSQPRRLSSEKKDGEEEVCKSGELNSPSGSPCVSPRSPLSCVYQDIDSPLALPAGKPIKLPGKRRAKVARSLSHNISAKSLDVLPSAISDPGSSGIQATPKSDLSFCTQSSPDLKTGIKIARKKLRLKSGGSETDLSALQTSGGGSGSLPWLSPPGGMSSLPTTSLVSDDSKVLLPPKNSDLAAPTKQEPAKKKKRKVPIRKSL